MSNERLATLEKFTSSCVCVKRSVLGETYSSRSSLNKKKHQQHRDKIVSRGKIKIRRLLLLLSLLRTSSFSLTSIRPMRIASLAPSNVPLWTWANTSFTRFSSRSIYTNVKKEQKRHRKIIEWDRETIAGSERQLREVERKLRGVPLLLILVKDEAFKIGKFLRAPSSSKSNCNQWTSSVSALKHRGRTGFFPGRRGEHCYLDVCPNASWEHMLRGSLSMGYFLRRWNSQQW